ncbi:MAG TPA: sodium:proton exchanger [Bacteroidetes bacterium]|nr:sodium:proton exchanger [Bacteroidota bacterium]
MTQNLILLNLDFSSPYVLIIAASVIIVLSYLYGLLAEKTSIPSVLMLIITGVLIKLGLDKAGVGSPDLMPSLEVLGIVGLIMIVLEAALDLRVTKETLPLIGKSFLIALLALLLSTFAVAALLMGSLPMDFMHALLYATPLCIMSSAIIIPSVGKLTGHKKEFMIYESAFSDILGIMQFYFLLSLMEAGGSAAISGFLISFFVTIIVAIIASYVLVFIFKDLKGHTRLFLLIAILLILYALGKLMHLSPLLIILIFGLSLSNHQTVFRVFKKYWANDAEDPIEKIEKEFHLITLETAFVVRTFFFVIFGMTIALSSLVNLNVFFISFGILACLYIVRFILLKLFMKKDIYPELYIAPRGLITILLFFAIPATYMIEEFDSGILLYVILISSLVMTYGLIKDSKKMVEKEDAGEGL